MSSVQFRGKDMVLKAYSNRDVAAWSIWQGRQFMFKYEGTDMAEGEGQLEQTLEMLGNSTNAIYTLKVYEDPGNKINSKTADDGSFNFRLNCDEQIPTVGALTRMNSNNEILSRLQAIEEKVNAEIEEEEEPESKSTIAEVINGIIASPVIVDLLKSTLTSLVTSLVGKQAGATSPALYGSKEHEADEKKIVEALQVLNVSVPDLPDLLQKLAEISTKKPADFAMYMNALRSIPM